MATLDQLFFMLERAAEHAFNALCEPHQRALMTCIETRISMDTPHETRDELAALDIVDGPYLTLRGQVLRDAGQRMERSRA